MESNAAIGAAIAAYLDTPQGGAFLEAAVQARMRQLGVAAPAVSNEDAFAKFLSSVERMLDGRDEQRPGFIRPLAPEELESRAQGKVLMHALIRRAKDDGKWPEYLLVDTFQGPSPAGPILYAAGQQVRWRGAPNENMVPIDETAAEIFAAYKQWIGEVVKPEEILKYAVGLVRGGEALPQTAFVRTGSEDIQVIDVPTVDVQPKRILGTNGPELRGRPMPAQPGIVAQPAGPVFVGEG